MYTSRRDNDRIAKFIKSNSDMTYSEIAVFLGRSLTAVLAVAQRRGIRKPRSSHYNRNLLTMKKNPQLKAVPKRASRTQQEKKIIKYVQTHPEMTYKEVAEAFGIPSHVVGGVIYRSGTRRSDVTKAARKRTAKIATYVKAHPKETFADIGRKFKLPTLYIARVARVHGVYRGKGQGARHNAGRSYKDLLWGPEERKRTSEMMLKYWETAPEWHRKRLRLIMRKRWDDKSRAEFGRAMKRMWESVL